MRFTQVLVGNLNRAFFFSRRVDRKTGCEPRPRSGPLVGTPEPGGHPRHRDRIVRWMLPKKRGRSPPVNSSHAARLQKRSTLWSSSGASGLRPARGRNRRGLVRETPRYRSAAAPVSAPCSPPGQQRTRRLRLLAGRFGDDFQAPASSGSSLCDQKKCRGRGLAADEQCGETGPLGNGGRDGSQNEVSTGRSARASR